MPHLDYASVHRVRVERISRLKAASVVLNLSLSYNYNTH